MISMMVNRIALSVIVERITFKGQDGSKETSKWTIVIIHGREDVIPR